jgi:hypothetical protein
MFGKESSYLAFTQYLIDEMSRAAHTLALHIATVVDKGRYIMHTTQFYD